MALLLLSRFSRVRLCATPEKAAQQAPPSLGFSRQEYWSGVPLPSPRPKLNEIKPWHLLLWLHFHQSHVSAFLVQLSSTLRVSKCHHFTTSEQWPLLWKVCSTCSGFCVFFSSVALLIARSLLFPSFSFLHLFYSFSSRRFPISLSHSRRVLAG